MNENLIFDNVHLDQLPIVAKNIISHCKHSPIFILIGNLGAGKTTLVKALCRALGCQDEVNSPTFAIINEYKCFSPIFHMDLYRIKNEEELYEFGFSEYVDGEHICFIEWPDISIGLIKRAYYSIEIEVISADVRKINVRYEKT